MPEATPPRVDNTRMRAALAAFNEAQDEASYNDVVRALMAGDLLLDITGSDLIEGPNGEVAEGSTMRVAGGEGPDGKRALFAYTSQAEVQRQHPGIPAQTLVQTSVEVVDYAMSTGAQWLYLDPAGVTCGISRDYLEGQVERPHNREVKQAIVDVVESEDHDPTPVYDALVQGGPLLLATNLPAPTEGTSAELGEETEATVATMADPEGRPVLLAFTSMMEGIACDPDARFVAQPARVVLQHVLDGEFHQLVIDPEGPVGIVGSDAAREIIEHLDAASAQS